MAGQGGQRLTPWNPADYPEAWADVRDQVLARAGACCTDILDEDRANGGVCEWCGARNGEPHPKTGSIVVLTTAHIYDRRPHAVELENLRALCQRCHNRLDRSMRSRPAHAKATGIGRQSTLTFQPEEMGWLKRKTS